MEYANEGTPKYIKMTLQYLGNIISIYVISINLLKEYYFLY
jgi:hypothetical protein